MDAVYINTFISSLADTFETMLGCSVQRGPLEIGDARHREFDVSGVIGLSGNAVGTVVVSLSKSVALQAATAMLLVEATEVNADVIDAIGEIANMVAGPAKAKLEQYQLQISLPSVVTGVGHQVKFPSNVTPITVPFSSPWGPLALTVGLTPVHAAVLV